MTEYFVWRRTLRATLIVAAGLLCVWSILVLTWPPAERFLHDNYVTLLWIGLIPGLVASGSFLFMHRPSHWLRSTTLNAMGWVLVIFLLYLRSGIAILLQRHQIIWQGAGNALNGLGFLLAIDGLVIYRVISFLQYRLTYRRAQAEYRAREAETQEPDPEI